MNKTTDGASGEVLTWPAQAATGGFTACRDLHAYWEALRGAWMMPARADFDPRGIEQTLACSFIAERAAPRVARLRVVGSQMNALLGMDVRGMPITAFFDPASRDMLSEAIRALFADPSMVVMELHARRGFGRKPLKARMLLLPLSDAEGNVTRLVGCLDLGGAECGTTHRFHIDALRSAKLTGLAPEPAPLIEPPTRPVSAPPVKQSYAFAEAPAPFLAERQSENRARARRSGIRLVVDNS